MSEKFYHMTLSNLSLINDLGLPLQGQISKAISYQLLVEAGHFALIKEENFTKILAFFSICPMVTLHFKSIKILNKTVSSILTLEMKRAKHLMFRHDLA